MATCAFQLAPLCSPVLTSFACYRWLSCSLMSSRWKEWTTVDFFQDTKCITSEIAPVELLLAKWLLSFSMQFWAHVAPILFTTRMFYNYYMSIYKHSGAIGVVHWHHHDPRVSERRYGICEKAFLRTHPLLTGVEWCEHIYPFFVCSFQPWISVRCYCTRCSYIVFLFGSHPSFYGVWHNTTSKLGYTVHSSVHLCRRVLHYSASFMLWLMFNYWTTISCTFILIEGSQAAFLLWE